MDLYTKLGERNAQGRPIRVGLIGAGKFGSMVLAQARKIPGFHMVAVADLDGAKARGSLKRTGWQEEEYAATSFGDAMDTGRTFITDSAQALCEFDGIECIIEATGHPIAGARHALMAIDGMKHIVMVNVECDVMLGPILGRKAREKGLVYSMAYGDQPAFMCELINWVRCCGFELVASGKGMNFCPPYRYSTPDTVWGFFGWSDEFVAKGDFNPQMYNSFTDGTKAAIEMSAVANATGMDVPDDGLAFHPCGLQDLAEVFKPVSDGGKLAKPGLIDIAASREPDGRTVLNNIQYGMFVTFRAPDEYTRGCFEQYGLLTDKSGWYGSMWRPFHLIGLETPYSVMSAVLRGEPTGTSVAFRADAIATAKSDLKAGSMVDGEGGFASWAKSVPATISAEIDALPMGLAHNVRLKNDVKRDEMLRMSDVELTDNLDIVELRREQVRTMGPKAGAGA
ncbi:MAG: NAD(P)H-dependent oxidoreductase [Tropicimonas sp.]|uniref:NAD(P)H-dependent oxidoreductase n=1 Tax=Tropicimonas sp. TaxID=2067044 RepID=UPI003A8411FE